LTPEARVMTIAEYGFTERQARFLELVMRHAGVCLLRQYSAFAGIVHGQKTRAFFSKLLRRGYATSYECRHNRGRIYHVHHAGLYGAIGEPNSRYRRPVAAGRTTCRLMLLDALLAAGDVAWLATADEVRRHFTALSPAAAAALQVDAGGRSSVADGLCADTLRGGIDPTGRTVLLHLVLPSGREDFRTFLGRHAALLSGVPAWTLRVVLPRAMAQAYEGIQQVVEDEWETPLHPQTLNELSWYFEQRRTLPAGHFPLPADGRFEHAAIAFQGSRFDRLYRRWLRRGAAALNDPAPTAMSEALASGCGRVECVILNHAYDHLAPVIDDGERVPADAKNGPHGGRTSGSLAVDPTIQP
jgi:hypothetical protein